MMYTFRDILIISCYSEINITSSGCSKNNTGYEILEKKFTGYRDLQKFCAGYRD